MAWTRDCWFHAIFGRDAGSNESVKLVTALLQVSAFPDNDVCSMSLNFWHRFARFLTDPVGRQSDAEGDPALLQIAWLGTRVKPSNEAHNVSCDYAELTEVTNGKLPQPSLTQAEQEQRLAIFVPAFEHLVGIIRGRVRYPDDYDQWHRDERSDFKRHRVAIGDTLLDAACES